MASTDALSSVESASSWHILGLSFTEALLLLAWMWIEVVEVAWLTLHNIVLADMGLSVCSHELSHLVEGLNLLAVIWSVLGTHPNSSVTLAR